MILEGRITAFDTVEQTRKVGKKTVKVDVGVMTITSKDGKTYNVWESAGTKPLFEYEEGTSVFLAYLGLGEARGGNNPPKLYRIGIK
jgi:hypothetical protein